MTIYSISANPRSSGLTSWDMLAWLAGDRAPVSLLKFSDARIEFCWVSCGAGMILLKPSSKKMVTFKSALGPLHLIGGTGEATKNGPPIRRDQLRLGTWEVGRG